MSIESSALNDARAIKSHADAGDQGAQNKYSSSGLNLNGLARESAGTRSDGSSSIGEQVNKTLTNLRGALANMHGASAVSDDFSITGVGAKGAKNSADVAPDNARLASPAVEKPYLANTDTVHIAAPGLDGKTRATDQPEHKTDVAGPVVDKAHVAGHAVDKGHPTGSAADRALITDPPVEGKAGTVGGAIGKILATPGAEAAASADADKSGEASKSVEPSRNLKSSGATQARSEVLVDPASAGKKIDAHDDPAAPQAGSLTAFDRKHVAGPASEKALAADPAAEGKAGTSGSADGTVLAMRGKYEQSAKEHEAIPQTVSNGPKDQGTPSGFHRPVGQDDVSETARGKTASGEAAGDEKTKKKFPYTNIDHLNHDAEAAAAAASAASADAAKSGEASKGVEPVRNLKGATLARSEVSADPASAGKMVDAHDGSATPQSGKGTPSSIATSTLGPAATNTGRSDSGAEPKLAEPKQPSHERTTVPAVDSLRALANPAGGISQSAEPQAPAHERPAAPAERSQPGGTARDSDPTALLRHAQDSSKGDVRASNNSHGAGDGVVSGVADQGAQVRPGQDVAKGELRATTPAHTVGETLAKGDPKDAVSGRGGAEPGVKFENAKGDNSVASLHSVGDAKNDSHVPVLRGSAEMTARADTSGTRGTGEAVLAKNEAAKGEVIAGTRGTGEAILAKNEAVKGEVIAGSRGTGETILAKNEAAKGEVIAGTRGTGEAILAKNEAVKGEVITGPHGAGEVLAKNEAPKSDVFNSTRFPAEVQAKNEIHPVSVHGVSDLPGKNDVIPTTTTRGDLLGKNEVNPATAVRSTAEVFARNEVNSVSPVRSTTEAFSKTDPGAASTVRGNLEVSAKNELNSAQLSVKPDARLQNQDSVNSVASRMEAVRNDSARLTQNQTEKEFGGKIDKIVQNAQSNDRVVQIARMEAAQAQVSERALNAGKNESVQPIIAQKDQTATVRDNSVTAPQVKDVPYTTRNDVVYVSTPPKRETADSSKLDAVEIRTSNSSVGTGSYGGATSSNMPTQYSNQSSQSSQYGQSNQTSSNTSSQASTVQGNSGTNYNDPTPRVTGATLAQDPAYGTNNSVATRQQDPGSNRTSQQDPTSNGSVPQQDPASKNSVSQQDPGTNNSASQQTLPVVVLAPDPNQQQVGSSTSNGSGSSSSLGATPSYVGNGTSSTNTSTTDASAITQAPLLPWNIGYDPAQSNTIDFSVQPAIDLIDNPIPRQIQEPSRTEIVQSQSQQEHVVHHSSNHHATKHSSADYDAQRMQIADRKETAEKVDDAYGSATDSAFGAGAQNEQIVAIIEQSVVNLLDQETRKQLDEVSAAAFAARTRRETAEMLDTQYRTDRLKDEEKQRAQKREEDARRLSDTLLTALATQRQQESEARLQAERLAQLQQREQRLAEDNKQEKYIVKANDTIESIAKKKLGSIALAPLLYELNKRSIKVTNDEQGNTVYIVKVGTVLTLASRRQVRDYSRRQLFNGTRASVQNASPQLKSEADAIRRANIEKLLGPIGPNSQGENLTYIVRLGDSLRSVALKHPALKDVNLWKLLAEINNMPTSTDAKGMPTAALIRGTLIVLPTQAQIAKFMAPFILPSEHTVNVSAAEPKPDRQVFSVETTPEVQLSTRIVETFSDTCRIICSRILRGGMEVIQTQLEVFDDSAWSVALRYEISEANSVRHEYLANGSRRSILIDLPSFAAQEMIQNDLEANWQGYSKNFLECSQLTA